jgi:hypothetical protein
MTTRDYIINFYINKSRITSGKSLDDIVYLQLAVENGELYNLVNAGKKYCVDPQPQYPYNTLVTHIMSNDDFFQQNSQIFDVIFIDSFHFSEQVWKDVRNSLKCIQPHGYIILDDIIPESYVEQTRPPQGAIWTGDIWKTWLILRENKIFEDVFSIQSTKFRGLGIIEINNKQQEMFNTLNSEIPSYVNELDWNNMYTNYQECWNIIHENQWLKMN